MWKGDVQRYTHTPANRKAEAKRKREEVVQARKEAREREREQEVAMRKEVKERERQMREGMREAAKQEREMKKMVLKVGDGERMCCWMLYGCYV